MKIPKDAPAARTNKEPDLGNLFDTVAEATKPVQTKQPKDIKNNVDSFSKADEKDAEQIVEKENTGQITTNELFYEVDRVDDDGKIIVGYKPSYVGVIRCMQEQGGLEVVGNPLPEHIPSKFIYTVLCKDTAKGISVYGQGFSNKMENGLVNPYAQAIALSIAARNGFEKLLYPEIKKQMLDEWYKSKYGEEKDMSSIVVVGGEALKDISNYIK